MNTSERACGSCTACCEGWLAINTEQIKAYPGRPCSKVNPSAGCSIYKTRPNNPCKIFSCGWIDNGELLPDWMKPSIAKVIVMYEYFDVNGRQLDLAVPVGEKIPEKALQWLTEFAANNNRPLLYSENLIEDGVFTGGKDVKAFAPEPIQKEIIAWLETGDKF